VFIRRANEKRGLLWIFIQHRIVWYQPKKDSTGLILGAVLNPENDLLVRRIVPVYRHRSLGEALNPENDLLVRRIVPVYRHRSLDEVLNPENDLLVRRIVPVYDTDTAPSGD
jgi:hypothetical protein